MYDPPMIKTFADLIGTWPRGSDKSGRKLTSIGTFAADIGVAYSHAQIMRYRNSIGADYWPDVVNAAKARRLRLSHEDLMTMRENARDRRERPSRPSLTPVRAA
jgi:hypothetical protein